VNPPARALYSPVPDSAAAGATAKRAVSTTRLIYLDPPGSSSPTGTA
jgi:hypothetical protein